MTLRALLTCALLALPSVAHAAQIFGPLSNCSGTVGGTAANIVFTPSVAAAPAAPQDYLLIQNNSTSSQNLWISVVPTTTANAPVAAVTAPPSIEILPTASVTFSSSTGPVPLAVSIIASASSGAYTCVYK